MIRTPETNGFIEVQKPQQIVEELDKHIIGQRSAKVALAIALRNRWRRMQLPEEMQAEIQPKNILMIGPTGVGKTELARKLAKLAKAPFVKVDATKFTEVGYVGRDVESIVRDLVEAAFRLVRAEKVREAETLIIELAEEKNSRCSHTRLTGYGAERRRRIIKQASFQEKAPRGHSQRKRS